MKKPKPTSFKKLQEIWYKKAAKAGFVDIEQNDDEERLKKWHSTYMQQRYTPQMYAAEERYYQLATDYLTNGTFDTATHKKIWELHTEGWTFRKIATVVKTSVWTISMVVGKYRSKFL